jgi:hypothetical protein
MNAVADSNGRSSQPAVYAAAQPAAFASSRDRDGRRRARARAARLTRRDLRAARTILLRRSSSAVNSRSARPKRSSAPAREGFAFAIERFRRARAPRFERSDARALAYSASRSAALACEPPSARPAPDRNRVRSSRASSRPARRCPGRARAFARAETRATGRATRDRVDRSGRRSRDRSARSRSERAGSRARTASVRSMRRNDAARAAASSRSRTAIASAAPEAGSVPLAISSTSTSERAPAASTMHAAAARAPRTSRHFPRSIARRRYRNPDNRTPRSWFLRRPAAADRNRPSRRTAQQFERDGLTAHVGTADDDHSHVVVEHERLRHGALAEQRMAPGVDVDARGVHDHRGDRAHGNRDARARQHEIDFG